MKTPVEYMAIFALPTVGQLNIISEHFFLEYLEEGKWPTGVFLPSWSFFFAPQFPSPTYDHIIKL